MDPHLLLFIATLLILTQTCLIIKCQEQAPIVDTIYGKIQGKIFRSIQEPHFSYVGFKGIPYARPPLNKLRFKPPLKPQPWNNIKLCQNYGSPCLQISKVNGSVLGNEDCLTLNVFTKNLDTSSLKPVMFWIHGGAHIRSSSAEFGPDYLVEKPIILVTVNYRLNIFGYFTVNDENAYGNTALKDQIAALEWVRDNIRKFGGNPSRVTIFGYSSGSDSACLLLLSGRAKGLFHQIIAQSGTALNSRYLQRKPLKYAYNIARYFNVSTNTTRDIVEGLQKIDAEVLTKAANSSQITGHTSDLEALPFYPIIEVENNDAIITRSPYELFQTGNFSKVPFVIGYNTNEGTLGLNIVHSKNDIKDFNKRYELFAPQSLNKQRDKEMVGKIVKCHFLGSSSARNTRKFLKFLGQELIIRGVRKHVDFQRKHSQGYFYRFSYKGTYTTTYQGVAHAEEVQYIFVEEDKTENLSKKDIAIRKTMVEMWSNFAIHGSPTPNNLLLSQNISWNKCTSNSVAFLDIGEKLTPGANPDEEEYEFWNNLFRAYGDPPYLTY